MIKKVDCYDLAMSGVTEPSCCSSCHYDWDDGYGDPMEDIVGNTTVSTCCSVNREFSRSEIAKALYWKWKNR